MKKISLILIVVFIFCSIYHVSWANKGYITDSFKITLRTGPSIENKVIMMMQSGSPLEVLDSQDDWTYVRVLRNLQDKKIEGWVLSRFLITRMPWEKQVKILTKKNAIINKRLNKIENGLNEAKKTKETLSNENKSQSQSLIELKTNYLDLKRSSSEYLNLKKKYQTIHSNLIKTKKKLETLTLDHKRVVSIHKNKWFLEGALVLFCGLIFGLFMGRQNKKRNSLY